MPTITTIMSFASLHEIQRTQNTVVVAYMSGDDQATREHFTAVANEMKADMVFCIANDSTMSDDGSAEAQGLSGLPSVVAYTTLPETRSVLREPLSVEAIRKFVAAAARPLIMEHLLELHHEMLEVRF